MSNVVAFSSAYAGRGRFDTLQKEAIASIEAASSYLNGLGRLEARGLEPQVRRICTRESMRLSNRLIQVSGWLTLSSSLLAGRITREHAQTQRARLTFDDLSIPAHNPEFDQLPHELQRLCIQSIALRDRILAFDKALFGAATDGQLARGA
ncbi:MAG: DUF1465 family protein [Pseudomonadota bacterium]